MDLVTLLRTLSRFHEEDSCAKETSSHEDYYDFVPVDTGLTSVTFGFQNPNAEQQEHNGPGASRKNISVARANGKILQWEGVGLTDIDRNLLQK